ncbi:MAG: hypothetical protein WCS03_00705, partial [Bacteroidota bacterium]
MKWLKCLNVFNTDTSLNGFAFIVFLFIPGYLFIFYTKVGELLTQHQIQYSIGFIFHTVDGFLFDLNILIC